LTIRFYRIAAETAATPETRQIGLMARHGMAEHEGMVFVFPQAARHCMWMKNTLIPLSVAFLMKAGASSTSATCNRAARKTIAPTRPPRAYQIARGAPVVCAHYTNM
jgi:uncharacterized membrane protein (UPF0127 family)